MIDTHIGQDFESVEINIVYNGIEKKVKSFSKTSLIEFKEFLRVYFKINYKFDLTFQANNKTINIEQIGFDNKKNNGPLNLKQLRLGEKSHIFITVMSQLNNKKIAKGTVINEKADLEEKKNCIVKLEDSEDVKIISK